jgi:hypothetical protein
VQDINGKVTALDSDCLMLKEFEEVTVAVNGSVQVSIELLVDVRALLSGVIALPGLSWNRRRAATA